MFPDVVASWWFRISHHQHESNAQRPSVAEPAVSEAGGLQGAAVWQELIGLLTVRKSLGVRAGLRQCCVAVDPADRPASCG